jgi:hypothetical protein
MINIGGNIGELYVGGTPIEKAYLGSQLVWEKSAPEMIEIRYLVSTGTQYIETGIVPDSSTGIHTFVLCDNNTDSYFVGLRDTSENTRWCIGHLSAGFYYGYGSAQKKNRLSGTAAELWLNYMNNKKFISSFNDSSKNVDLPTLPFTPVHNIRLFGSAGISASYSKWSGRIYYAQISQGSDLIMDLIPVRVGQVGYMYDKVSGNLFGNSGTGSFTLGPDVT